MNKTLGKIILAIIILSQFVVSFGMSGIERYQINQLEEKGKEVKILLRTVEYCDGEVRCTDGTYSGSEFIVFCKSDNGYYECSGSYEKPRTDTYINRSFDSDYSESDYFDFDYFDSDLIGFVYDVDEVLYDVDYKILYDKNNEFNNINFGCCEGPQTQAELVMKIYKGRYIIENIYINGITVEEVLEKASNGEIDLSRYNYY
ncbi:MAG: hypothetical protein ACI4IF_04315 [Acutalibacteraceae bacterium]